MSHARTRFQRGAAVVAGLLALMTPAVNTTPAQATAAAPALPAPTGSSPVGFTALHLKDTSRPDPWVPSVKYRELMVSVWYPAKSPGRHRAQYMTPKESELLLKDGKSPAFLPASSARPGPTPTPTPARPGGSAGCRWSCSPPATASRARS